MQFIIFYNAQCIVILYPSIKFVILFLVLKSLRASLSKLLQKFVEFLKTLHMHILRVSVEINVISNLI